MGFIVKISYRNEGYSQWHHESMPVNIYDSVDAAHQQACHIFIRDDGLDRLSSNNASLIRNLLDNKKYYEAFLEINFLSDIKFTILPTVTSTAQSIIFSDSSQLNLNFSNPVTGATCRLCKQHNSYASSDSNDGMFTCWACRKP